MKVTSDSNLLPVCEGADTARRLVEEDALAASEMRLEIDGYVLRFKDLRSGNAMLFREDRSSGVTCVALDAYERHQVAALISLIANDPKNAIASIEWQEDNDAGIFGYIIIVVAIALGVAAFYGLYVEFFR